MLRPNPAPPRTSLARRRSTLRAAPPTMSLPPSSSKKHREPPRELATVCPRRADQQPRDPGVPRPRRRTSATRTQASLPEGPDDLGAGPTSGRRPALQTRQPLFLARSPLRRRPGAVRPKSGSLRGRSAMSVTAFCDDAPQPWLRRFSQVQQPGLSTRLLDAYNSDPLLVFSC